MRLKNHTNTSNTKIREIIQFVKPINLPTSNFDIRVTNRHSGYCGVFYEKGGYAKKGVGSDSGRPLIIARITPNENKFPYQGNNTPTRTIKLYYEKYNEKKGKWEVWRSTHHVAISEAYISRKNKELRDKGKFYDWNKSTGGYIDCLILSREEALVHVLAHELKHLWQKNHPGKRGRVWGARGQYSDRDADAYAIKKVREWRRQVNNNTVGLGSWP